MFNLLMVRNYNIHKTIRATQKGHLSFWLEKKSRKKILNAAYTLDIRSIHRAGLTCKNHNKPKCNVIFTFTHFVYKSIVFS